MGHRRVDPFSTSHEGAGEDRGGGCHLASRTVGTPHDSRPRAPIAPAENHAGRSRTHRASPSTFSVAADRGFAFRSGRVDPRFPLPCAWRGANVSTKGPKYRRDVYNV